MHAVHAPCRQGLISGVSIFCASAICAICPNRNLNENRVQMDVYQVRTMALHSTCSINATEYCSPIPHALARISAHHLSWLSHPICVLPSLSPPLAFSLPLVHRRCLDNTVADLLAVLVRGPAAAALVVAQDTILSWRLRACSSPRSASRFMDEQTLS